MPETFTLSHVIPSTPQRIFEAWLSSAEHSKMTGVAATIDGDQFTAWDGYIAGKTLSTVPHSRIVQTWRTNEFPEGAPDADLVIGFAPVEGGTNVTIEMSNIPDGQREGYEAGWNDFYFAPMTQYFGTAGAKFKEASEALENAVETAVEQASAQVTKAVNTAKKGAQKQTAKAVKSVKKAAANLGKKVKAAFQPKKKAAPAKKAAKKVAKKVAAKAKPAKKAAKKAAKKVIKKVAAKKAAPKKAAKKKSRR